MSNRYPSFLRAYPKIFGIFLYDVIGVAIFLLVLTLFDLSTLTILIAVIVTFVLLLLFRNIFPRRYFTLLLTRKSEFEYGHKFRRLDELSNNND
ncbi:MAG: hypothetical protein ISR65_02895 [Bacteriovoracaceae bacterium]|nr:hypothetical protein [Bacteriovoracaceae bacterium]